jgi:hypothetical protein
VTRRVHLAWMQEVSPHAEVAYHAPVNFEMRPGLSATGDRRGAEDRNEPCGNTDASCAPRDAP